MASPYCYGGSHKACQAVWAKKKTPIDKIGCNCPCHKRVSEAKKKTLKSVFEANEIKCRCPTLIHGHWPNCEYVNANTNVDKKSKDKQSPDPW